jgi:hypothetical protein
MNWFKAEWNRNEVKFMKWNELGKELVRRLVTPASHPEFIMYFSIITGLTGLIGVFTTVDAELRKCTVDHNNITLSLATYFIALIASSSADLVVSGEKKMLKVLGICLILSGVGLFWLTLILPHNWKYIPAIFGTLLSLITWWVANSETSMLVKDLPVIPEAPLGGAAITTNDSSIELLKGDVDGFQI